MNEIYKQSLVILGNEKTTRESRRTSETNSQKGTPPWSAFLVITQSEEKEVEKKRWKFEYSEVIDLMS